MDVPTGGGKMSESRFRISGLGNREINSCRMRWEADPRTDVTYFCKLLFESDRQHCILKNYPKFLNNSPLPKVEKS